MFQKFIFSSVLLCSFLSVSQNLIDLSTWSSGSTPSGWILGGVASENSIISYENHLNREGLVWRCHPNHSSSAYDGGWAKSEPINSSSTYQLSVWVKKEGTIGGATIFATTDNPLSVTNLNSSTVLPNPVFWSGDLPVLNRWYLLVAQVHNQGYSGSTASITGMYDGVTGEKESSSVYQLKDFKFINSPSSIRHRLFLYRSGNTNDYQYQYAPRIDLVDGTEPTLQDLLLVNPNSKLSFKYNDNAGNQSQRLYCSTGSCIMINPPPQMPNNFKSIDEELTADIESIIKVYPNPSADIVTIDLTEMTDISLDEQIQLFDLNGKQIGSYKISKSKVTQINISDFSTGTYFLHLHDNKGKSITQTIIKK